MITKMIVKPNQYHDSITLMRISSGLEELEGVSSVIVGMGTDLNKESCQQLGLASSDLDQVTPSDLIIGVVAEDPGVITQVEVEVERQLKPSHSAGSSLGEVRFCSLDAVAASNAGYNLALIATPGAYAAWEAEKALNHGMHVFMFSDNVSIENECRLKSLASEKGLLMMGPDCGTALINGVPLGFVNRVRNGNIGVISASGTGLQEFMTLVDLLGGGIRSAIGTGGRDLSEQVGGMTTLSALELFDKDENCQVIAIISKPPAEEVAQKILSRVAAIKKPCVICMLGSAKSGAEDTIHYCPTLSQAAIEAVTLSLGTEPDSSIIQEVAPIPAPNTFTPDQRYLRALFCGGTLADECILTLEKHGVSCHTNTNIGAFRLQDVEYSVEHTVLDMGDDRFTVGKPHPMIEPALRNPRLLQEALDPQVRVVLFDVELGYGSHPDPAGTAVKAVNTARQELEKCGRKVQFIATLIGTNRDPQNMEQQRKLLTDAGVAVFVDNARAATFAIECLGV